jgi:hypothetical protein
LLQPTSLTSIIVVPKPEAIEALNRDYGINERSPKQS